MLVCRREKEERERRLAEEQEREMLKVSSAVHVLAYMTTCLFLPQWEGRVGMHLLPRVHGLMHAPTVSRHLLLLTYAEPSALEQPTTGCPSHCARLAVA